MSEVLKAPMPYFGGKADIAEKVWERFGNVPGYIEPFYGTGAVLLARPLPFDGVETINDKCGLIANFWRAVQSAPEEVAKWADRPVFENDLHAIHAWLVSEMGSLAPKLEGDRNWFDAEIAGLWCWGICCWIGSGWCSGDGPWQVQEVDGVRQLVHLSNTGRGVNRQLVHLSNTGMGINRKLVHLSDAGMGVNRKLVHLSDAGRGETASESISATPEWAVYEWMQALSDRLKRVRVCCGDWRRVCGGNSGDSLKHFFAGGNKCAIFLDPPYSAEANRNETLYREEDLTVAHDVREWAIKQGDDPRLRIALCGYSREHAMPANWSILEWKTRGGYASAADGETNGKANCRREVIHFSPHCLKPIQDNLL